MATIAQIRADLVGSSASFRAAMVDGQRQANTSLAEIRRDVASTSSSISALNKTAVGFLGFEAVKAGVNNLLDAQKAIQQIHYSLLSATGSGTAANEAYDAVSKTAQRLGLDLQTSALGFSSMSAAANANGVSMKDQMALFEGLARSSTVLHLSSEQSGRAITALSQIFGKGKIQAEELRQQLGDAIPGVVPRFQAAVMAMTKGTDLAGKSFDQLLQGGDITVQRFLPALIQALNDTGRGAEQAVNGPVAALNRLSSEWFKLKADLSGGLFADAAVGSINLVTNNLEHLADVAGITGGLVVARLAGNGLDKAATGVSGVVQQQREARAAAVATTELAAAESAAAAAEIKQNEAALRGVTIAREQAIASRDAAAASLQKAIAENEAAQATLNHQRTAATLSANTRAQRIATADAAAAQASLTRAQVQYNASAQATVSLKEQQIALEGALFRARGAATIATEAEVAAERQLAATGAAALVARGAAGVGNLALSLVGGPWGAAVAAIGAVGYAIYDTQKRSENYRHETDELVKSIQQVRTEAEATAKTFGTLDSSMSIKQGLEQYQQESQAIAGQRKELQALQDQAEAVRARIASRSGGTAGGAFANLFDYRELEQVNDRIEKLQGQIGPASTAVDALGNKMAGVLAPSIDSVKHAIDQLASGKPLLDVIFDLSAGADKGIAAADTALANVRSAINGIAASTKQMTDKAATDGLNNAQKAAYEHAQRLTEIAKLAPGLQGNLLTSENDGYATNLKAAQQLDAADAAKKAASEAASQARQWKQQADNLNQSLQQTHNELAAQLDTTQRLTPEEKKLQDILGGTNDAYNHASESLQRRMLTQAQANAELSKSIVLHQQEAAAAARSAALQDQLASRIQRQTEANDIATTSVGHGQQLTQQLQDELRIRQEYDRQRLQYDKEAGRLQPGAAGSVGSSQYNDDVARMVASQQQELAIYRAGVQARLDAEGDWRNGAQAAFEDYAASAADVAGQTKASFTSAFSQLEDDLVKGKLNFTSFANSVIQDMLRMQVRGGLSTLAQYGTQVLGSLFGYDASGGAGAASYGNNGQVTHVNFGGGRATGGPTAGGMLYEVAEGGRPEIYQSGGRTYLLSGQDGHVTPAGSGSSSIGSGLPGGLTVNIINNAGVQVTQKQGRGQNGMPSLDFIIDAVDAGMADKIASGRSRTGNAMAQRMGTSMAANL
jgi:lambda family phage tail tape measure protein